MKSFYWDKPKTTFSIFTLFSIILMISLGLWQISRLGYKEALIDKIETANVEQHLSHDDIPNNAEDFKRLGFRKANIRGVFLNEHEIHIAARYYKGQLGYHVYSPFRMEDERIILLNRGWIPVDLKEITSRPDSVSSGVNDIQVQIRTDNDRTYFTPDNSPEDNVWFYKDIKRVSETTGVEMLPFAADVIGEQGLRKLPVPSNGDIRLRNDHLGYSITWFGIAFAIAGLYISSNLKRRKVS